VVEHLAHGHRAPGCRHPAESLGDRVVEPEPAGANQVERHRAAERLGDAGDPHVVGGLRRSRSLDVGSPRPQHGQLAVAVHRRDRSRRSALRRDQPLEPALDVGCTGGRGRSRRREAQREDESYETGGETPHLHPAIIAAVSERKN
jgi:hypothetical protein